MRGQPHRETLWGKTEGRFPNVTAWHPLLDHLIDVAAVMEELLAQPTFQRRLSHAGGFSDLTPGQRQILCCLAFLHDFAKTAFGFQSRGWQKHGVNHLDPIKVLFSPPLKQRFGHLLDAASLSRACGGRLGDALAATLAHHGTPIPKILSGTDEARLHNAWRSNGDDYDLSGLETILAEAHRRFPAAFDGKEALPTSTNPAFWHLFAGLLNLADIVASGSNPDMFPFSEENAGPREVFARARAIEVLTRIGLRAEHRRIILRHRWPSFNDQFRVAPRPTQAVVDSMNLPPVSGSVTVIEDQTGSGKTEAYIRLGTRMLAAGLVDGIAIVLPTRSAAVQLHKRMQEHLTRAFPDAPPEVLLAVPGYFRMGKAEGTALPEYNFQWDDDKVGDRRPDRWAAEAPRRYAAAQFLVGTIDQILLAVLQRKYAHMRFACLSRLLVVVDEVHASDPYMQALLQALISNMRACGGHVLLGSATLGDAARTKLLKGPHAAPPSLSEAMATPSARITSDWGSQIALPLLDRADELAKFVALRTLPLLDRADELAKFVAGKVHKDARIAIICNTVDAAVKRFKTLEAVLGANHPSLFTVGGVSTLHHGRFASADRPLLDTTIEARAGKNAAGGLVVVTTQTIEQSLDVCFDLLITDVCPIDVLLQRIGRLHRHKRPRPPGFDQARCFVLGPPSANLAPFLTVSRHGLGLSRDDKTRAYPDLRAIEATLRLIGNGAEWSIPHDSRRLVESGTHPEALNRIASELGDPWVRHGQRVKDITLAREGHAGDIVINQDTPFSKVEFIEESVQVLTRLGLDDLSLPLTRQITSPFGAAVDRMVIPGWMVAGNTWKAIEGQDNPKITVVADDRLTLADQIFTYDRLGLRPAAP